VVLQAWDGRYTNGKLDLQLKRHLGFPKSHFQLGAQLLGLSGGEKQMSCLWLQRGQNGLARFPPPPLSVAYGLLKVG
jgi:hypothetical protein